MAVVDSARISGNVAFEGVSFHFADQDSTAEAGVLQDINLGVREGEVVAVLGATGSGKSSLIALLSRFYDVSRGRVLLDGVDVRDYELEGLRRNIGIVPQETFLFSTSIRDNIAYGSPERPTSKSSGQQRKRRFMALLSRCPLAMTH